MQINERTTHISRNLRKWSCYPEPDRRHPPLPRSNKRTVNSTATVRKHTQQSRSRQQSQIAKVQQKERERREEREGTVRGVNFDRRHIGGNEHEQEPAEGVGEREDEQGPPERHGTAEEIRRGEGV